MAECRRRTAVDVRPLAIFVAGLSLLAACHEQLPVAPKKPPVYLVEAINCTASPSAKTIRCRPGESSIAPSRVAALAAVKRKASAPNPKIAADRVILGGQGYFVNLVSQNVVYTGTQLIGDITVQNLTPNPMGTSDGDTYDGTGVQVFFRIGPTDGVTINNAAGTGSFIGTNESFFQYPELLPANATSVPQSWIFDLNGLDLRGSGTFSFIVYVTAMMPAGVSTITIPTTQYTTIATGYNNSCAIRVGGAAYCWGTNDYGELGDGRAGPQYAVSPLATSGKHTFTLVTAGNYHACAIETSTGFAYCWGYGGGIGDGSYSDHISPIRVASSSQWLTLSAGSGFTCGVVNTGDAFCWGVNGSGQLGNGIVGDVYTPSLVSGGFTFTTVTTGDFHACGIVASGDAYCWGDDTNGQLGDGVSLPNIVSAAPSHSGGAGAGPSAPRRPIPIPPVPGGSGRAARAAPSHGAAQPLIALPGSSGSPVLVVGGHHWIAISAGGNHTCGITDGFVGYCWGSDLNGELGDGGATDQSSPTPVSGLPAVTGISAGNQHSCAVIQASPHEGWCWGFSSPFGELGDGTSTSSNVPVPVGLSAGTWDWTQIVAGRHFTCGLRSIGTGYCWGDNSYGESGFGFFGTFNTPSAPITGGDT
jgi:alpha-tubulin suppressor-like RCC1 family protein